MKTSLEAESVSLSEMWNEVITYKRFFFINLCIWIAVAIFYILITPNEYSSNVSIVLTPSRITGTTQLTTPGNAVVQLDSFQAESQIQVLKSERNLRPVLGFYSDQLRAKPAYSSLEFLIRNLIKKILPTDDNFVKQPSEELSSNFQSFSDKLNVRRVGSSYVLELSYRANSPKLSAQIANSIALQYLYAQIELKSSAIEKGGAFLQNRIIDIQQQLASAKEGVQTGVLPAILLPDADAQIISAAIIPTSKSWPSKGLIIMFAFALSTMFSFTVIVVISSLNQKIRFPRSIRRKLGILYLGGIKRKGPLVDIKYQDKSNFLVTSSPRGAVQQDQVATIRAVQQNIVSFQNSGSKNFNCILPLNLGNDHAYISLSLAYVISLSGKKTLLIDLDFEDAILTSIVAPDAPHGLFNLDGITQFVDEKPFYSVDNNLLFLASRSLTSPFNPNIQTIDKKFIDIINNLPDIEVIIACLPRYRYLAGINAVVPIMDSAVLIVDSEYTNSVFAREIVELLNKSNIRVVGAVLIS